ncbi:MAG: leucine-rich repeat protein, partial [Clostridiales bacterium]|nr:leucine-rich repeat protein [Clostridiales bacterium]
PYPLLDKQNVKVYSYSNVTHIELLPNSVVRNVETIKFETITSLDNSFRDQLIADFISLNYCDNVVSAVSTFENNLVMTRGFIVGATGCKTYSRAYYNCKKLEFGDMNGDSVEDISFMYYGCESVTAVYGRMNGSTSLLNMESAFDGAVNLVRLNGWNTENVTNFKRTFANTKISKLQEDGYGNNIKFDNGTLFTETFYNCSETQCLYDIDTTNGINQTDMFYNCKVLFTPGPTDQDKLMAPGGFKHLVGKCDGDFDLSLISDFLTRMEYYNNTDEITHNFTVDSDFVVLYIEKGTDLEHNNYELVKGNYTIHRGGSAASIDLKKFNNTLDFVYVASVPGSVIPTGFQSFRNHVLKTFTGNSMETITSINKAFYQNFDIEKILFSKNESIEDATYAFNTCMKITELPGIGIDNLTTIHGMCMAAYKIKSFGTLFSGPNNIVDMGWAFGGCKAITEINVYTEENLNYEYMFASCTNLKTITGMNLAKGNNFSGMMMVTPIEKFEYDIPAHKIYFNMFWNCSNLICIKGLDTTGGSKNEGIFDRCDKLLAPLAKEATKLMSLAGYDYTNTYPNCIPTVDDTKTILNFRTDGKLIFTADELSYVFDDGNNNESYTLVQPNTIYETTSSAVITIKSLGGVERFSVADSAITSANIIDGDAELTNLDESFSRCYKLKTVSGNILPNVTSSKNTFGNCQVLEACDLSLPASLFFNSMYRNCYNLVAIKNMAMDAATQTDSMFQNCSSLKRVIFELHDPQAYVSGRLKSAVSMFEECAALIEVNAYSESMYSGVTDTSRMYNKCGMMLSNFTDTGSAQTLDLMYGDCYSLKCLGDLDTTNMVSDTVIFKDNTQLLLPGYTDREKLQKVTTAFHWTHPDVCSAPRLKVVQTVREDSGSSYPQGALSIKIVTEATQPIVRMYTDTGEILTVGFIDDWYIRMRPLVEDEIVTIECDDVVTWFQLGGYNHSYQYSNRNIYSKSINVPVCMDATGCVFSPTKCEGVLKITPNNQIVDFTDTFREGGMTGLSGFDFTKAISLERAFFYAYGIDNLYLGNTELCKNFRYAFASSHIKKISEINTLNAEDIGIAWYQGAKRGMFDTTIDLVEPDAIDQALLTSAEGTRWA